MPEIITKIDGTKPTNKEDGRGYGPVGKSNSLAIGVAGVVSTIVVAILLVNGIVLDPALVSGGTAALALGLGVLFTYFTPSRKIIEVVEVVSNRDLDGDTVVGNNPSPVPPNDVPIV